MKRLTFIFLIGFTTMVLTQEKIKTFSMYPNPVAPRSTLTLVLNTEAEPEPLRNVVARIYNLLGQKVTELKIGVVPQGRRASYQVISPDVQATGLYICRITSANKPPFTERLLILK